MRKDHLLIFGLVIFLIGYLVSGSAFADPLNPMAFGSIGSSPFDAAGTCISNTSGTPMLSVSTATEQSESDTFSLISGAVGPQVPQGVAGSPEHAGRQGGFGPAKPQIPAKPVAISKGKGREIFGEIPLYFEPNHGQTAPQIKFISRGLGYTLALTTTEAVLISTRPDVPARGETTEEILGQGKVHKSNTNRLVVPRALHMRLVGANPTPKVTGLDVLTGKIYYARGNDPEKWLTHIPTYARVKYEDVYKGIDLIYYASQGLLEYDFVVAPGADPRLIRLEFEGADKLSLDNQGNLVLRTPAGEILQHAPRLYQEINGARRSIVGRYELTAKNEVVFRVDAYDVREHLIIDPMLRFSTYLGGSATDEGKAVAVDKNGNVYIAGKSHSRDFLQDALSQAKKEPFHKYMGHNDCFVTKLDPQGALIYSTFVSGAGDDQCYGIAVDKNGNAYVTGRTQRRSFPETSQLNQRCQWSANPFKGEEGNVYDAFVAKLVPSGGVKYSILLSGCENDVGRAITVDDSGNAYVTGETLSGDFPTTKDAFDKTFGNSPDNPGSDAFVAKVNAAGDNLVYSTYLGGSQSDVGYGIAIDDDGNAYITGTTFSLNFPSKNAIFFPYFNGASDAFVTVLNSAGKDLLYSGYYGGGGNDVGYDITLGPDGDVYVAGSTYPVVDQPGFPIFGSLQTSEAGKEDAFLARFKQYGKGTPLLTLYIEYSIPFGGSLGDRATGIAVDYAGHVYISGWTSSNDLWNKNPWPQGSSLRGNTDYFVAKINPVCCFVDELIYSTYLGGSGEEGIGDSYEDGTSDIATDGYGSIYVTGGTTSINDFPIEKAIQPKYTGDQDAFVTKLSDYLLVAPMSPSIRTMIKIGSLSQTLEYEYKVSNDWLSEQNLDRWTLLFDPQLQVVITASPDGWFNNQSGDIYLPGAVWTSLNVIEPGSSESGFKIEADGLPGIVQAIVRGPIPIDPVPPLSGNTDQLPEYNLLVNSVIINVLGPVSRPTSFGRLDFLNTIISLNEEAFILGWIDPERIKKRLDKKLDLTQKSLINNKIETARKTLEALLDDVEEAYNGELLTSEAYALLKFNVQYLLDHL